MIKLLIALAILQASNIMLGSADAIINDFKTFDWATFLKGILKGLVVFTSVYAIYIIGIWLPDLIVIGDATNFSDFANTIVIAALVKYAIEVGKKVMEAWGIKQNVSDELGLVFDEDIEDEEEITEADIEIKEEETEAGDAKLDNAEGEQDAV